MTDDPDFINHFANPFAPPVTATRNARAESGKLVNALWADDNFTPHADGVPPLTNKLDPFDDLITKY